MVAHACNPSTWETETGGILFQGQPELHSKTLSQKQTNKKSSTPQVDSEAVAESTF
jgi:hypothetical protein